MKTRKAWPRICIWLGFLGMLLGSIDPLEGSVLILGGSALLTVGTYFSTLERARFRFRAIALVFTAIGAGALFILSSLGGLGGRSGHSFWWGLLLLPYLLGWWMTFWGQGSPRWVKVASCLVGLWYMALPLIVILSSNPARQRNPDFLIGLGAFGALIFCTSLWLLLRRPVQESAGKAGLGGAMLVPVLAGLLFSNPSRAFAQTPALKVQSLNEVTREASIQWLTHSGAPAEKYVVSKFSDHDLVMLGETHEVKENCEFVASLIAPMHEAGVRTLCSEFLCSRHNSRLAEIVVAKDYDEEAVVNMFRTGPWPTWGYQEYMDIVRSVWAFNRRLPAGAPPFRIVGIDSDWKQRDLLEKEPAHRMSIVLAREEHLVDVLEKEVFAKGEKALLHIGFAHTVRQGKRVAATLSRKHGKRMFQVCMHHEIPRAGGAGGLTAFIEELAAQSRGRNLGFDVAGTPLATLRDDQGQYFQMLGRDSTFKDFAEGYVFLKPVSELSPVTWRKGFIVPNTFMEAKTVSEKLRWVGKGKCLTPEDLDAALAARMKKRQKPSATRASQFRYD